MGKNHLETALILSLFLIALSFSSPRVSAATVSINDLVESASDYDNQTVTIVAEVIGEALNRGEYTWLNVNDGTNAIGVWVPSSEAETLVFFGDYDTIGDTISLTGVFHRSCPEHGGDVDLHAGVITVTAPGSPAEHPLSIPKLIWAVSLSGAALLGGCFYLRNRPRKQAKKELSTTGEE